jgi:putative ABC transport system permease protein
MLKNYLKIAWRNLIRHKVFSLINIGGLTIGITACLLISLYVHYQFTYDAHNLKENRIERIACTMHTPESDNVRIALSPALLASALKTNFPEVGTAVRFQPVKTVIKINNQVFNQDDVYAADPDVFKVFTFTFIHGDPSTALTDPHNVAITASLAKKYFGNRDAMGKSINFNKKPCRVSAIIADLPENSDLKISALLPADFSQTTKWMDDDFSVYTFVLFKQKIEKAHFQAKLDLICRKDIQPELDKMGAVKYSLHFDPEALKDVHFDASYMGDTSKGDKQLVYIFSVLAFVILFIALLNYISLSTARATERAKEVGVRKVNGALRSSLIRQFLFESFFITLIAMGLAVALMFVMLPFLNHLLQTKITVANASGIFWIICGVVLLSSLLTGVYPAFVLSAFKPVTALKASVKHQVKGLSLRKVITVTQFVVATVMIAGAFVMNRQINFLQHKALGYSRNQVLTISLPDDSLALPSVQPFNNALKQLSVVQGTSVGDSFFIDGDTPKSTTLASANGLQRNIMANYFMIDPQFIPLLKMDLKEGRNFSDAMMTDPKQGFIVNEAFVRQMGWKKPVGQAIEGMGDRKGHVIGVVSNFHYNSMHNPIAPLVMVYGTPKPMTILAKLDPKHLDQVKAVWQKYFPDVPFTYTFLDDAFNTQYQKDITSIKLFNYFTSLSILIACLGLYGLAFLVVTQRTKEIGIRKVLGAAFSQLLVLLAKDFVKLIAIASVIAIPLTILLMQKWLATYAYHIAIKGWLLIMPVCAILLIGVLVISYQAIKVAVSNPVKSLRSE